MSTFPSVDDVLSSISNGLVRMSRFYRNGIALMLKQIAFFGIDVEMQIDALTDDFVNSKTFLKYVERVFDECDVDGKSTLAGGEFHAAVLLLYHRLNRLPFSRKKFPPSRKVIMRLFDECYADQQMQLQLMVQSGVDMSTEELPINWPNDTQRNKPTSNSRLKKVAPRVIREIVFSMFFFGVYLTIYNYWICRNTPPVIPLSTQVGIGGIVLCVALVLFNGTELLIDEQPEWGSFLEEPQETERDEVRAVSKPAFIAMCQDHFTDVLASETWRILTVAVLLPILAFQFKKFIFSFQIVRTLYGLQSLFSPDVVMSAFVSLVLLIFPFIDSMVERNLLWNDFDTDEEEEPSRRVRKRNSHRDPFRYVALKHPERAPKERLHSNRNKRKQKRNRKRESVLKQLKLPIEEELEMRRRSLVLSMKKRKEKSFVPSEEMSEESSEAKVSEDVVESTIEEERQQEPNPDQDRQEQVGIVAVGGKDESELL